MKKSLLVSALVLMISAATYGQASIELGLKAGANFANADVQDINSEGITSFHGGAYGMIKITKIAIQPELLYSTKGAEVDFGTLTDKQTFDYLDIPVLVKFYLIGGLNVYAGPQFSVLVSADSDEFGDIKDDLKSGDFAGAVGVGLDLPFGLNATARYTFGLSDVSDVDGAGEINNNVFQLAVGFTLFKLGN